MRAGDLSVADTRCEYQDNPLGIDALHPRFSWTLRSSTRGTVQEAYQVQVALSESDMAAGKYIWDTGRTASEQSTQVHYNGPAVRSGARYVWRVKVWDQAGQESAWSQNCRWEEGLLSRSDWHAHWIIPELGQDPSKEGPAPMLRREFRLAKPIASARLYATARGLYQMEINGRAVSGDCLTPGWTAYDFRYQYQTYDVTDLIATGANAIGAMLGDGWFRGQLTWDKVQNNYGDHVALMAQLVVTYADGTREIIGTDESWRASTGPVLFANIYDGETYDARLEKAGWSSAGFDDSLWAKVRIEDVPASLDASAPPVRRFEEIRPVRVFRTPSGQVTLDLGQNMVGWMRFKLRAPAGHTVVLKHAEILDKDGNLYFDNLRKARQAVAYTARGARDGEVFEPHFTFQGFRYVQLENWPGEPNLDDFRGVVVHSQLESTGSFSCSDALINQLQHNIVWGQKGNFVDIPSDCPQRDERLGWTGDTQVFSPTACFNFGCALFYSKWLRDLALDQQDDGAVPWVIPNVLSHASRKGDSAATGWADSALVVPWTVYRVYGDTAVLERQYASMKAWVEYMRRAAGERYLWTTGDHFGDWLAFATIDPSYPGATTDKDFLQTAYFAHSVDLLQRAAAVLGRQSESQEYRTLLGKIKAAFVHEYVTSTGRISPNTQTAYALALAFDLLPQEMRRGAADRLAADVRKFGHLTTGFLGTPVLCHALSGNGHIDEAYLLLNRREYPSWLYPVTRGATTIWERWDGQRPDGTLQDVGMNSFNHYAYGAIGDWLYQDVAGIRLDPEVPAYKRFLVEPQPGGGLTWADASYTSMYGRIRSAWHIREHSLDVDIEVPANASARVCLPRAATMPVLESGAPLEKAAGVSAVHADGSDLWLVAGSGRYHFSYPW